MVLSGRTEAFEPLVSPYRRPLLALAYRLTRDREDAREVAQEAFLKAFRSLARYDVSRSFRNWLFQIAANEARDRRRRARETAAFEDARASRRPRSATGRRPTAAKRSGEAGDPLGHPALARLPQPARARGPRPAGPRGARHPGDGPDARMFERSRSGSTYRRPGARSREAIRRDFPHLEEGR